MNRFWIFLAAALFSCLAKADFLDNVLNEISSHDEIKAEFTDTWKADYLEEDVVTRGKLRFQKPNILIKEITDPEPLTYTVSGNSVKIEKDETIRHMSLSENSGLAMGIHALRMLLQGDREGLEKMFLIQFRHSDDNFESWMIDLYPKASFDNDNIKKIDVSGKNGYLRKFKIEYLNNDVHITRIQSNE